MPKRSTSDTSGETRKRPTKSFTEAQSPIPMIIERFQKDKELSEVLTWKSGGGKSFIACLVKFKVLAARIHKEVALRHQEGCDSQTPHAGAPSLGKKLKPVLSREARIRQGNVLLKQRLDFLGLDILHMDGDGNCQFRAISQELFGSQDFHQYVRERAISWLRSHSEQFSFFIGDEKDWDNYLQVMSKNKSWGDELTLRALCDAFGIVIHLVTTEKDNWHLRYDPAVLSPHERHAFLAYISPIHYNTLIMRK